MPTVYITTPREHAEELARFLIEERLAACVNVVDCRSTYRWDDQMHADEAEAILLAKTTAERYPTLETRLAEAHPYDVPCIERFDETDLLESFDTWIETETG